MRNLQNELIEAKNHVDELSSNFIKDMDKKFALSEEGNNRRIEDTETSLELLKNMNLDLAKIREFDDNEPKKAKETLEKIRSNTRVAPKEILSKAQQQIGIDEILSNKAVIYNPYYKRFFINSAIAGIEKVYVYHSPGSSNDTTQGNCGDITYGSGSPSMMTPWCLASGANCYAKAPKEPSVYYGCIDEISVVCSLWFFIPREYIPQYGTLTVAPYFDIHGFFWDRANMVLGISKEAAVLLRIQTWLHPYTGSPTSAFWDILSYDGHNIDESGRVDFTGYSKAAQGTLQVAADEPVLVQIVAELDGYVQGAGSMALLDFNGEGNAIKIPYLSCVLHTQPVNYP